MRHPQCDFCSAGGPLKRYRCASFVLPNIYAASAGDWMACSLCCALIDAGDPDALAERAIQINPRARALPCRLRAAAQARLTDLYRRFCTHRLPPTEEPRPEAPKCYP